MSARDAVALVAPPWHAELSLAFRDSPLGTRLATCTHRGPLVVQRPLYPEGPAVCHAIVVHPPGGIADGDRLDVDVDADGGAHALLTTPGAAKLYKSAGRPAVQDVRIAARGQARVEWLPQETIVFDAADASLGLSVDVDGDACVVAWDIVTLGREAMGERFMHGRLHTRIVVRCDGQLVLEDVARSTGGSPWLDSPVGWRSARACGTFVVAGRSVDDSTLDRARESLAPTRGRAAVSRPCDRLLVGRYLGPSAADARAAFAALWAAVRVMACGRPAIAPRIWAT